MRSSVRTKTGDEEITAYSVNEYKHFDMQYMKRKKKKRIIYSSVSYAVLDTETSHCDDTTAWIYQWAFLVSGTCFYGRKPSELVELLRKIYIDQDLSENKHLIVYVHNLSYDFQYLKHYFYEYDPGMRVFAVDTHTYLKVEIQGFVFLCSWKLSAMSLDLFSKSYSRKYIKASGEINYTVVRYQNTQLTPEDWHYMFSDVYSQHDAIGNYLLAQGYETAYDAPITSTGFVRADCREAALTEINWRKKFYSSRLDDRAYKMCLAAFMGGSTICAWTHAEETVRGNIGHVDFTSSYPARQMLDYFPSGKPFYLECLDNASDLDGLLTHYCCIFQIQFNGISLKKGISAPYIPSSKCIFKTGELKLNGKIVYADSIVMIITEIDYAIIKRQYTCKSLQVADMLCFSRGSAPKWMKNRVMHYFQGKSDYKTMTRQPDISDQDREEAEKKLMISKARLNGIYGMTATKIIRMPYDHDGNLILEKQEQQKTDSEMLDDYYNKYNSFLPYQYGLYTTAHARKALFDLIEAVGYQNFLYCDTDSIFYMKSDETEKAIADYNKKITERAEKAGAIYKGKILGYADAEEDITAFRGLHSKCYAYEDASGKLTVTIAGIRKKADVWMDGKKTVVSNAEELESIDNLKDGFIFRDCGGVRCVYVEDKPHIKTILGHRTELSSSAIILPIEKEVRSNMWTIGKDYSLLKIEKAQIL